MLFQLLHHYHSHFTGCPSKPLIEEVEETTPEITPTEEEEEEWDLVIFGDSTAWGFGKYYAAYIEEDLGIKVTVHDKTYPRQTAFGILKKLHDDEELRELVSGAEVVTFIGNPEGLDQRLTLETGNVWRLSFMLLIAH